MKLLNSNCGYWMVSFVYRKSEVAGAVNEMIFELESVFNVRIKVLIPTNWKIGEWGRFDSREK